MRVSRGLTSVTDDRQRGSRSDTPFKDGKRRDATRRDVPAPGRIFCRMSGTPDIFTSCQAGVATHRVG
ncbi:hypothetical protein ALC53_13478 [Atta colombica]|uniref:Uncharacterized protein n=1 Tax=Atta colombica TaxID=520822 RepID=A0A195AUS9_9HYME|nr:hypothetical protein ALC53_13478 [Atta colombica]